MVMAASRHTRMFMANGFITDSRASSAKTAATKVAAAVAQTAANDRESAIKHLEMTRAKFLKSIDGLTEAQWTFKPAPDRWSIAEVAEHIGISEGTILGLVQTQMLTAPGAEAGGGYAG